MPPTKTSRLVNDSEHPPLSSTPCLCLVGMGQMHVPGIFGCSMCTFEHQRHAWRRAAGKAINHCCQLAQTFSHGKWTRFCIFLSPLGSSLEFNLAPDEGIETEIDKNIPICPNSRYSKYSRSHRAWAIFYSKRISQTFCFQEKSFFI